MGHADIMQAEVAELLAGRDRFDPEITPKLEAYVEEQVSKGTYDLEANLALLRFYQYNPATAKIPIVCKILMKALMKLPETDFMLCLYLLPVAVQKDAQIETLKSLWDKLETCQFKDFWAEAGGDKAKALLTSIPKFDDAMRSFIIGVVGMTYQLIEKEHLELMLNLKGAALDAMCTEKGFKVQGSDVAIPAGDFNRETTKD